jgi:hypothetical protein
LDFSEQELGSMTAQNSQQNRPQLVPVSCPVILSAGCTVLLSAGCAGGMARQFRVQVLDGANLPGWSLVGSFRDSQVANKVAEGLSKSGKQARVVACRSLPTAA